MKLTTAIGLCLIIVIFSCGYCADGAASCSHLKTLNASLETGYYVIDPDGAGGEDPFTVLCDMSDKDGVGVTVVGHDSEAKTYVGGFEAKGSYGRPVNYNGTNITQVAGLVDASDHCEQFIRYDCHSALLLYNLNSWLESRNGSVMNYWGGASPGSGKCACGMVNACSGGVRMCNCDRNDFVWRYDQGPLTYGPDLPVSALRFGDTGGYGEKGFHTLGRLYCWDDNECLGSPCANGSTCIPVHHGYSCSCVPGIGGSHCEEDIDECLNGTHNCHVNATCNNTIGSFTCKCRQGYIGNGTTCSDLDECVSGGHDCHVNATCNNTIGSYECHCQAGFNGTGQSCSDVNECLVGEHPECVNNSACFNEIGTHRCECSEGYEGDATVLCNDVDECSIGDHDCHVNATCNNTIGSYECHCRAGFNGTGQSCSDVNECLVGEHPECVNNSACFNEIGTHSCECNEGYEGDATVLCNDVDECAIGDHDCHVNATCNNTIGSYECHCQAGFNGTGQSCSDVNECLVGEHPECVNNSACFNEIGTHSCECNEGYEGDATVLCNDVDECAIGDHNCHVNATCNNTIGSYECQCRAGFNGTGQSCSDVDECLIGGDKDCVNNSVCVNTIGSFDCKCIDGFEGNGRTHCKGVAKSSEAKPVLQTSAESVATATFACVLVVATLVVNAFLALKIVRNVLEPRRCTNYFLLNLCGSNVLVAVFTLPVWLTHSLYGDTVDFLLSETFSAYWLNVDVLCCTVSFLSLVAGLLDCCLAVLLPSTEHLTPLRAKALIGGIWAYGFVVSFQQEPLDGLKGGYSLLILCASFILPAALTTILLVALYHVAHHHHKQNPPINQVAKETYARTSRDLHVALTTALITGVFVGCWLPFFIVSVCADFAEVSAVSVSTARWLTYLSAFLVPAVYLCLALKLYRPLAEKLKRIHIF